jgi:hypothetical protein
MADRKRYADFIERLGILEDIKMPASQKFLLHLQLGAYYDETVSDAQLAEVFENVDRAIARFKGGPT